MDRYLSMLKGQNAIAVLEIEKWNNRFGRWVNKGAKGIGNKSF